MFFIAPNLTRFDEGKAPLPEAKRLMAKGLAPFSLAERLRLSTLADRWPLKKTLRDATQEDYQFLYDLHRDMLKEYLDRTWEGMKKGRLITFGRNSICPAG
jgi:hypothetical protein